MMSGTSLDGVDAALLEVGGTTPATFSWQLLGFHSESYLPEERDSIRRAIESGGPAELTRLHAVLGERFARCALAAMHARRRGSGIGRRDRFARTDDVARSPVTGTFAAPPSSWEIPRPSRRSPAYRW